VGHGTPDWREAAPKETTYVLGDMSELAVRLGSIVSFDRRGDVIWFDDFRDGIGKFAVAGSGTGNDVWLLAAYGLYRGLACNLHTGNLTGNASGIDKVVHYPVLGGVGLECSFVPHWQQLNQRLCCLLYDGTNVSRYQVRFDQTTGKVEVFHSDGTWYTVGTPGAQRTGYTNYSTMKMVFNCLTGKHVRVLFNGHNYDSSAYAPTVVLDATAISMELFVYAFTSVDAAIDVVVGSVILTQNEPL